METLTRETPTTRRAVERTGPAEWAGETLLAVEDVWKRYPAARSPNVLERALARLGGIDLSGLAFDLDGGDEEEGDDEEPAEEIIDRTAPTVALSGVSFTASAGTCVALVGPAGSGKSSLLRVVAGLTPPSSGTVAVSGMVAPALDSLVKLVPTRFTIKKTLLAISAIARLPRGPVRRALPTVFQQFGSRDLARVPSGALPIGRRRELLLALMLSLDADVLLVDLPVTAEQRDEWVADRIAERKRAGALVLVAADHVDEVEGLADRFLFLEQGKLLDAPSGEATEAGPEGATPSAQGVELVGSAGRWIPPQATPRSPDDVEPNKNTVLLLPLLRALIGEDRTAAAVDEARRVAFETGKRGIPWPAVVQAAGLDFEQMRDVVVRLRDDSRARRDQRRIFNEHAAIFGARVLDAEGHLARLVRVDRECQVEVLLEAATMGVEVETELLLEPAGGETVRLVQPEPFVVTTPGPHRITVRLPSRVLAPSVYHVSVLVRTAERGGLSGTVAHRRAVRFRVRAAAEPPVEGEESSEPAATSFDASWRVER